MIPYNLKIKIFGLIFCGTLGSKGLIMGHQKNSYERRDYESADEKILS